MNVQSVGAAKRPRLSLPFGGRTDTNQAAANSAASTLSGHELRQAVAQMID
jgi:hypothetical protein